MKRENKINFYNLLMKDVNKAEYIFLAEKKVRELHRVEM
jgi:hypothetical protein